MDELFPIAAGLVLGILFAAGFWWLRLWWVRSVLVLLAGVSATVLSGEYRATWAFLLVDVGEVALLAWIGFVAAAGSASISARRLPGTHPIRSS
jgi:hypothetical protein